MTNQTLTIRSVNTSAEKGELKTPVPEIELNDEGVRGDAHAGPWHRQVSMLGTESFTRFSELSGMELSFGAFAENITTEGIELRDCHPLDRFVSEDIELEITQIGKKCHGDGCAIFSQVGECVMPKEGIFCRVLKGGRLKAGDQLEYIPRKFRFLVITLSDRAYKGVYEDKSGPEIVNILKEFSETKMLPSVFDTIILPDDGELLRSELGKSIGEYDFILTTGGTGIGDRDITPDIVREFIQKEIPGIMEMIRVKYGSAKPQALLSRGICGIAGITFIATLPGSVRGSREYTNELLPHLKHIVYMLAGLDVH